MTVYNLPNINLAVCLLRMRSHTTTSDITRAVTNSNNANNQSGNERQPTFISYNKNVCFNKVR